MVLPHERNREWQGRPYAFVTQERSDWQGTSRIMELSQFAKKIDGNSLCFCDPRTK
jgi:hypothetical protein